MCTILGTKNPGKGVQGGTILPARPLTMRKSLLMTLLPGCRALFRGVSANLRVAPVAPALPEVAAGTEHGEAAPDDMKGGIGGGDKKGNPPKKQKRKKTPLKTTPK